MSKKTIAFGKYEFTEGDSFMMPNSATRVRIIQITQDKREIYVTLKYGEADPEVMRAEVFAYYVTTGVYQPTVLPRYKIGNRFIQNYSNKTVEILGISPAVDSTYKEYMYFCILRDEAGIYTYIAVRESQLSRMIQIENAYPENLPKPPIPPGAELPEVVLYYHKHDHGHHHPRPPHHHCPPHHPHPPHPCPPPKPSGSKTVMQILDDDGNVVNEVPMKWEPGQEP